MIDVSCVVLYCSPYVMLCISNYTKGSAGTLLNRQKSIKCSPVKEYLGLHRLIKIPGKSRNLKGGGGKPGESVSGCLIKIRGEIKEFLQL